ncbi:MAG: NAD(P)/FAD-dependent oxidoreductase [Caldilineaceae bacterium]
MSNQNFDVAIAGAGPAGSAAAAALAQLGWSVLLVEQDTLPRHKVCGEFLSPEAQGSLQRLGLIGAVDALGPTPLHSAEISAPGGQFIQLELPGTAMGVSRFALDNALASAAQEYGVTLWTGTTVLDFVERGELYELRLRTATKAGEAVRNTSVHARQVILATGRHSRLALSSAGSQSSMKDASRCQHFVGIKCHFADVDLPNRVALYFFDGGYGGANPVEGGRANVCMLVTYEAFRKKGKSPTGMMDMMRGHHPLLEQQLAGAHMLPETFKTVGAVDTSRPVTPWQGVPCVGDAAAMITPLCGDGMAMALRAAELCAPLVDSFLRRQVSQAQMARAYTRTWHREFDSRLRVGRMVQALLGRPALADVLVAAGRMAPPLARYFMQATRGTSLPQSA